MEKITEDEFTTILKEHETGEGEDTITPENMLIIHPGKPTLFRAYIDETWLTWEAIPCP